MNNGNTANTLQECKPSGTPNTELDCRLEKDRAMLVMNHCVSPEQFFQLVQDQSRSQLIDKLSMLRLLQDSGTWRDCKSFWVKLDTDHVTPGDFISIELASPIVPNYYSYGFFRGLFEKFPDTVLFDFYLGIRDNKKQCYPFKLIYFNSLGKLQTAYFDFSQEEPEKPDATN